MTDPTPREAAIEAAAKAVVAERQDYDAWDDYSPAEQAKVLREQRTAIDAYEQALASARTDDARHVTWDHGRRTLCGKQIAGDPGDFYLPLGKAPRFDEGGAWCWSCLQLQDETAAALAEHPKPPEGDCPTCHGEGIVEEGVSRDEFGAWDTREVRCGTCHGEEFGNWDTREVRCGTCHGEGRVAVPDSSGEQVIEDAKRLEP